MGQFQTPITIKSAINKIHERKFLLPAIQRKFTWSSEQIEMLFDSILRGFPISSFMFWRITDPSLKSGYKFYEFLTAFREYFNEDNKYIPTSAAPDFDAIIDGQQRLTSLYIGLRGSYAYKKKGKWWINNEENLPTRHLYLNIGVPIKKEVENQKIYDFRFLTAQDIENYNNANDNSYWFKASDILDLDDTKKVKKYLKEHYINGEQLYDNEYAEDTLLLFYERVHKDPLINYYLQEEQDPDNVLEVFLRTNSGGTPLSFSDLLMSMTTANWKIDAREEITDIVKQVSNYGKPPFKINKDFVLKTCLYLFVSDIKFKVRNFKIENILKFEDNWDKIKKSIVATFNLLEKMGFNDSNFRAKNAAIPLIYYIYYKDLSKEIVKANYDKDDKKSITKWLILSFLKQIFSGQSDGVLQKIRTVLKETSNSKFPSKEIVLAFKTYGSKDYSFTDDFLDGLLSAEKDSADAFYVLHLLYPNLDYYVNVQSIHQDHLHPKVIFEEEDEDTMLEYGIPEDDIDFACENWNTVANLQLLEGGSNSSKNDTPLAEWVKKNHINKSKLLVEEDTSLDIKDFRAFIETRRSTMKNLLKQIIDCDLVAEE
jgi:uncharacterized protein with ParB-like and HNH nuclease domain